jgi:hypothetical protein
MARLQPRRREENEEQLNLSTLGHQVEGWWGVKFQSKVLTKTLDAGKNALLKIVQRYGETEAASGHVFLRLEEPVSDRKITRLKAERAESTSLNTEECEKILTEKGIWGDMVEWVPQLDEGKVYAAYFDKKITDDELARMTHRSVIFKLILLDDNDKPVN